MPRWVRNALVLVVPPLVVSAASVAYGISPAAWLPHFAALLLAPIALGMAIRLRWSPATVILPARFLMWAGVGAAWGVAWSLVLVVVLEYRSIDYAITSYAIMCALTAAVALACSFVLSRMLRRVTSTAARPRPWTTLA
jgi:hypothetical protein